MTNFSSLAAEMKQQGAAIEVGGAEDLIREISDLLKDPQRGKMLGERAYAIAADRGVLERSIDLVVGYLQGGRFRFNCPARGWGVLTRLVVTKSTLPAFDGNGWRIEGSSNCLERTYRKKGNVYIAKHQTSHRSYVVLYHRPSRFIPRFTMCCGISSIHEIIRATIV